MLEMKLLSSMKLLQSAIVNLSRNFGWSCQQCGKQKVTSSKPNLTEKQLYKKFVDEKRIIVNAGKGGDGKSCFLRDKITAFGGPCGGNGGRGGDVIIVAEKHCKTLAHLKTQYHSQSGKDGGTKEGAGRDGKSIVIQVPLGTLVRCYETEEVLADLSKDGDDYLACTGGVGGKGNQFFVSSVNTTPQQCTSGMSGETAELWVEMRTLAHAGLVGFPNAGKSTLLRALTKARPAVAAYAFTTLTPHVGIMHFEDFTQIAIADTPGIIEGAHRNRGRGIRFLKHIERCRFLLYVIDLTMPDPWKQIEQMQYEFEHFNFSLSKRPGIVLANKVDLPGATEMFPKLKREIDKLEKSLEVIPVSGKTGQYIEDIILKIREKYDIDMAERKQYGRTIPLEW
ncbi:mitochondrial ribosome-associated GTPase 2-like [Clavelina lepadiformis]|uniref:mitochondrial ribosome-associated GTPase 2-like n=1 Tax=Clavelina lepadiformis TaxID=159417 RepID=UPI0040425681